MQMYILKFVNQFHIQVVLREQSGFVVGPTPVKDVWKCAEMIPGALCVMISGMLLMLVWCAVKWASPDTVCPMQCYGSEGSLFFNCLLNQLTSYENSSIN